MLLIQIEPPHDKTNKMACAPSEDLDQPGHWPSLIRVFAVRMKKAWVLNYGLIAQRRLCPMAVRADMASAKMTRSWAWIIARFCPNRECSFIIESIIHQSFHHCIVLKMMWSHERLDLSVVWLRILQMHMHSHSEGSGMRLFVWSCLFLQIWAASWQNQQNDLCPQQRLLYACASTWRYLGSFATHSVHSKDSSDWVDAQADMSLCWAHMLFCCFCHEVAYFVWANIEGSCKTADAQAHLSLRCLPMS